MPIEDTEATGEEQELPMSEAYAKCLRAFQRVLKYDWLRVSCDFYVAMETEMDIVILLAGAFCYWSSLAPSCNNRAGNGSFIGSIH